MDRDPLALVLLRVAHFSQLTSGALGGTLRALSSGLGSVLGWVVLVSNHSGSFRYPMLYDHLSGLSPWPTNPLPLNGP